MKYSFLFPLFATAYAIASPIQASAQVYPSIPSPALPPLQEAPQAFAFVSRDRAYRFATLVPIVPGRNSLIDFRTDEAISFIQLSDPSKIVYTTNAPLDSGAAKTIILRQIEELEFPRLTHSTLPNLTVTTIDSSGQHRTYQFDLQLRTEPPSEHLPASIAVVPAVIAQQERIALNQVRHNQVEGLWIDRISTAAGAADIDDIEQGLEAAIERGYTPATDPIVAQVRETIAQARQGTPLQQAIEIADVPQAVMVALGEIGLQQQLRRRLESPSSQVNTESTIVPVSRESLIPEKGKWQDGEVPSSE